MSDARLDRCRIGNISNAYIAGREDRRDNKKPATARARGESSYVHQFYLEGHRRFRWTKGCPGFPQMELFVAPGASQEPAVMQLDISPESQARGGLVSNARGAAVRPRSPATPIPILAPCTLLLAACLDSGGVRAVMSYRT